MVSQYRGGYSGEFLDAQEFASALAKATQSIENGERTNIQDLLGWFAPTCAWDDFAGSEGIPLGNEIYSALKILKK